MVNIYPPVVLDDPFPVSPPPPIVNPNAPIADFVSTPFLQPPPVSSGSVPFTVQFQDTSSNSPTSLEWDFNNDGSVDSTISNPTYTFATAGTYTVRLRATNAFGSTEKLQTFIVDSAASAGNNVNLEVTMGGPSQATRNTTFNINVLVRNEGLDPATNVQRTLVIPNVGNEQISVTAYPPGTTLNRVGTLLYVNLPVIPTLTSGTFVNQVIGIMAPSLPNTTVVITSSVTSPEVDPSPGDNTSSLSILVRP
jgi:PKD repeat protein